MPSWASPSSGPAGKFSKLNTAIGEARLASRVRNMLGVKEDPNVKVGINGFGVMGRLVCKACQEIEGIDVVAINDPYVDVEYMAYQLQHPGLATGACGGPYQGEIVAENEQLMLDGRPVTVMSEPEPDKIEWVSTGAKYVVDCTGAFNTMRKASGHFKGGAQKVIVAGACGEAPQYVMGANHKTYKNETLVSAGTPANHCLALLVKGHRRGGCGVVKRWRWRHRALLRDDSAREAGSSSSRRSMRGRRERARPIGAQGAARASMSSRL